MSEKKSKGPLFKAIEIETNTACNLTCKTCPNKVTKRPFAELPFHVIEDILDGLARIEYSGIISPHFYNEPMLDKRLDSILALARRQLPKAYIFLFTNFTLMTVDRYRKLFPLVDKFIVTIDEPIIENAVDSVKNGLSVSELEKLETRSIINKKALSNRAGAIRLKNHKMKKRKRCSFPQDYMTIDASGNVHLCCNDYYGRAVYGNIIEKDFLTIWFSREFRDARRAGYHTLHPLCEDCVWSDNGKD